MSWARLKGAIRTHLRNGWSVTADGLPVPAVYSRNSRPPTGAPKRWVRFTIFEPASSSAQVGRGYERGGGLVIAQVFVPEEEGEGASDEIADACRRLLRGKRLTVTASGQEPKIVVTFDEGSSSGAGVVRDGVFQLNVEIPYTAQVFYPATA